MIKQARWQKGLGAHKIIKGLPEGTNHARDAGWRKAKGEVIAFLDADCVAPQDWLNKINSHFQSQPDLGLLCGRYDFPEMSRGQRMIVKLVAHHLSPNIIRLTDFVFRKKGVYITGGNFIVKKKTLESIGGLNTFFKFWGDDVNAGLRIVRNGYEWKYDPQLIVATSLRRFKKEGYLRQNINLLHAYFSEYFKDL